MKTSLVKFTVLVPIFVLEECSTAWVNPSLIVDAAIVPEGIKIFMVNGHTYTLDHDEWESFQDHLCTNQD